MYSEQSNFMLCSEGGSFLNIVHIDLVLSRLLVSLRLLTLLANDEEHYSEYEEK